MDTALFRENAGRLRVGLAAELGCQPAAFDGHDLTIVPRPPEARGSFVAVLTSFGTGTVASIQPAYLDFARALSVEKHFRAMYGVFLDPLVEEGRRRGEKLASRTPNLCFTLSELREPKPIPEGLTLAFPDPAWRRHCKATGVFHNALGSPEDAWPESTAGITVALIDPNGEPAAVVGTWDEAPGIIEIGVDVARTWRGHGFAEVVVNAAATKILELGRVPVYMCAPTNIRSHRTALACGFLPVASFARVGPEAP